MEGGWKSLKMVICTLVSGKTTPNWLVKNSSTMGLNCIQGTSSMEKDMGMEKFNMEKGFIMQVNGNLVKKMVRANNGYKMEMNTKAIGRMEKGKEMEHK